MRTIEVVRGSDDGLSRKLWTFWYDERNHTLKLDGFDDQRRLTRRHKFVSFYRYSRLYRQMDPKPDSVPADVIASAREMFCAELDVAL